MYKARQKLLRQAAVHFYSESLVTDAVVLGNSSHSVYRFLRMRFRGIKKAACTSKCGGFRNCFEVLPKNFS